MAKHNRAILFGLAFSKTRWELREKKYKTASNGHSQKSKRPKSRNPRVAATVDLQLNSQLTTQDHSNFQNKRA